MPERDEIKPIDIYERLGKIQGTIESMEKQNGRITLALIGLIAAQIGVKVMGTPILLDIATTLGIIAIVLLIGVLAWGLRIYRNGGRKMTHTGISLIVMITLILVVQVLVYCRDLGWLPVNAIYVSRIIMNLGILYFAWRMMGDPHLFYPKSE